MRKKLIIALWAVTLSLFIYGCEKPSNEVDYQQILIEAAETISLPSETNEHIDLPGEMTFQEITINLVWSTDNANVLSNTGVVTRPTFEKGDRSVRLTVVLSYDTYQFSRALDVKVLKLDQAVYFTVIFETNGGSEIGAIQIESGKAFSKPFDPTKAGYSFVAWYQDSENGNIYDFTSPVVGDVTLYASYSQDDVPLTSLTMLYLNDLHGSIEKKDKDLGLAYIANFMDYQRSLNPKGTIILGGGDMLQGSALSNYYLGQSTIEIMSAMGFDAMVVGNHEFDWGIDVVTNYFDGNPANGEATFPLLGANIFHSGSMDSVAHIDPYTIIEREDVRIGVIGTIGYGLEESIAASKVSGYVFASPVDIIESYATMLRRDEKVDYVFVVSHDSGNINQNVSSFTGDAKVDLIFNAHSHTKYTDKINNTAIIQSGSNGRAVGVVTIDLSTNEITTKNVDSSSHFYKANTSIQTMVDTFKAETDILFNTEIIKAGPFAATTHISQWLTDLMIKETGAAIAFHNNGGTRASISEGESITLGKLYQIFPFDNIIKTVTLDGGAINNFITKGNTYSKAVTKFETGVDYLVVTNDYLFDKPENPFLYGSNPDYNGTLLRDMVEAELKLQALVYSNFSVDNPILTNSVQPKKAFQSLANYYN